jgi:hypothetical protein
MVPETCWTSNKICNKNSSVASSRHFISTCAYRFWCWNLRKRVHLKGILTDSKIILQEKYKNKYTQRVGIFVIFFLRSSYILVGLGGKDVHCRTIREKKHLGKLYLLFSSNYQYFHCCFFLEKSEIKSAFE